MGNSESSASEQEKKRKILEELHGIQVIHIDSNSRMSKCDLKAFQDIILDFQNSCPPSDPMQWV